MQNKMLQTAALAILTAGLGFGQKVNVEFDDAVDFKRFTTFAFRDGNVKSKHPQLDNTLTEKKIKNAIIQRLTAKGLRETGEKPDIVVTYRMGSKDRRQTDTYAAGWRGRGRRRVSYPVTDATLVIDIRDPAKRELIWRAVCRDTAQDPSKLEDRIHKDVEKAFKDYPPQRKQ